MKTLTFAFLMLCTIASFGQSQALYNKIAQELNHELEGGQLRGQSITILFSKNKEHRISYSHVSSYPRSANESIDKEIARVLSQYVDSLVQGEEYGARIYYDMYSTKAYTVITNMTPYNHLFINLDNPFSSPKNGMSHFMNTIYTDLSKHKTILDTLSRTDWNKPIELLIDSTGLRSLVGSSKLVNYLDSTLRISWNPSIYNGAQIATIVDIRLDRIRFMRNNEVLSREDRIREINNVTFAYALSKKYQNNLVKFESYQKKLTGEICVSLVFNPLTSKLENPVILNGNTDEAKKFITWLKGLYWHPNKFYRPAFPYATRSYFYINPNSQ
jgi:hypothetical protein